MKPLFSFFRCNNHQPQLAPPTSVACRFLCARVDRNLRRIDSPMRRRSPVTRTDDPVRRSLSSLDRALLTYSQFTSDMGLLLLLRKLSSEQGYYRASYLDQGAKIWVDNFSTLVVWLFVWSLQSDIIEVPSEQRGISPFFWCVKERMEILISKYQWSFRGASVDRKLRAHRAGASCSFCWERLIHCHEIFTYPLIHYINYPNSRQYENGGSGL